MVRKIVALALLLSPLPAFAVDFGVMESADPLTKGDVKFEAYPLATSKSAARKADSGVNAAVGYGFSERADVELQVATYEDVYYLGSDVEYNLVERGRHSVSTEAGVHYGNTDLGTQLGADFTPLYSYRSATVPGLQWNAALDLAYDDHRFAHRDMQGRPEHFWSAYVAPGATYRVAKDVDVIGEIGLGLNGNSSSYGAIGLSLYFR